MNKILLFISTIALTIVYSCGESGPANNNTKKLDTPEPLERPTFFADSAFTYIQKQVDFGPRVPNTPEHDECGVWLAKELEKYGAEVIMDVGVNAPGMKMSKKSKEKLDKLINDVQGFKSVKLLNKKKAEFLFKDGSTKVIEF